MGFNKKFVQPLDKVMEEFEEMGEKEFIRRYSKVDSFVGPTESIQFINTKITNFYKS